MNNTSVKFNEARYMVNQYLDSGKWWTVIAHDKLSAHVAEVIERTFYTGKKNADFHLGIIPLPGGLLSLVFAHKRHMRRRDLVELLTQLGAGPDHDNGDPEQDIIIPVRSKDINRAFHISESFNAWLNQR